MSTLTLITEKELKREIKKQTNKQTNKGHIFRWKEKMNIL